MRFRKHLSYANVIASLALFIALGGGAYAALKLPKGSVTSRAIKNGQVKRADLAKNSVNASKVKDGSLAAADFAKGALPAGPAGPAGPTGLPGATGDAGTDATTIQRVAATDSVVNNNATLTLDTPSVSLAAGETLLAYLRYEAVVGANSNTCMGGGFSLSLATGTQPIVTQFATITNGLAAAGFYPSADTAQDLPLTLAASEGCTNGSVTFSNIRVIFEKVH